jgi:hypothetical protein
MLSGSRRWLTIVGAISALALMPSVAQAYSIHDFRIRDAGPEIVAKVTVCTWPPRGYEHKFYFRVHVELRTMARTRGTSTSTAGIRGGAPEGTWCSETHSAGRAGIRAV